MKFRMARPRGALPRPGQAGPGHSYATDNMETRLKISLQIGK